MSYSANTLTSVLRAQASVNIDVPQEPIGILETANLNFDDKGASINEVIVVPIDPVGTLEDIQPAAVPPAGASVTVTNAQVKITSQKQKSRVFTGEDLRQIENIGVRDDLLRQFIEQSERLLRNQMAADASTALTIGGSRAVGTAGTTPFATDMNLLTSARKVFRDNGAPFTNINVVADTSSYLNLLNLNVVQKAQEAGSDQERRSGIIRGQFGLASIREDANINSHTKGAGTGYTTVSALAVGDTSIAVTGGTVNTTGIQIGDIITIAGDTNKYVVVPAPGTSTSYQTPSSSSLLATSGTIYIGAPGIRKANAGTGVAITVGATYSPSFIFEKNVLVGVVRPPIGFDQGPYVTIARMITDKFGLSYHFVESVQWGQVSWFVQLVWGFAVTQPQYVVPILG